jgi:hypothetical protein
VPLTVVPEGEDGRRRAWGETTFLDRTESPFGRSMPPAQPVPKPEQQEK